MSDIRFLVSVDSKKGKAAIKELDQHFDKLEKTSGKTTGGLKNLWLQIGVGIAAFHGVSRALRGVIGFMKDAVKQSAIQEQAENDLRAALESTGREVNTNTDHFIKYASSLQKSTVYGDEAILNVQALLIQLTKLDRQGLDVATKGALGLASVYKIDLQSAATLVGKALAGNYGALSRYGIVVKQNISDEEKRVEILRQLLIMYGRSEKEVDTFQGAIKQLSNTYGDMKEEIGKAVTENEMLRIAIKALNDLIRNAIDAGYIENWVNLFSKYLKIIMAVDPALRDAIRLFALMSIEAAKDAKIRKTQIEAIDEYIAKLKLLGELKERLIPTEYTHADAVKNLRFNYETLGFAAIKYTEILKEANKQQSEFASAVYAEVLPAVKDMTGVLVLAAWQAENFETIVFKTQKMFADLGETQKAFWLDMVLSMEEGIKGILSTLKRWAIAEAVKWIFAHIPFPASVIVAGGAVGTISALYGAIAKAEKGAYIPREMLIHAHPDELISPRPMLRETIREVIQEREITTGRPGFSEPSMVMYATVNIYPKNLDDRAINDVSSKIFRSMEREANRFGFSLKRKGN